jgi:hypothetical protein
MNDPAMLKNMYVGGVMVNGFFSLGASLAKKVVPNVGSKSLA